MQKPFAGKAQFPHAIVLLVRNVTGWTPQKQRSMVFKYR
jgi:hypothetical protein